MRNISPSNYTSAQLDAKEYLCEQADLNFTDVTPKDSSNMHMLGELRILGEPIAILIRFPLSFPLEYPKLFTDRSEWFLRYPHIEFPDDVLGNNQKYYGICLEPESDKSYEPNPTILTHTLLAKAKSFVHELMSGELDQNDFYEELESYQNMHVGTILLDSEIELKNSGFINMNHAKDMNNLLIIADTTRLDNLNIKGAIASKKMLYFDLKDHYRVPFPITVGELHKSIIQAGHKTILQKAYKQKGLYPYLLIRINLPDGKKHYIAYLIEDFLPKTLRGSKSRTFSILTYLSNPMTANRYLSAYRVRHFNKQRVFYRAAGQKGEKMSNNNLSIAIIGCGSVGASLAFKLAKSGFSNILLIDPQLFDIDNTGRHILGLESIGVNKAEATAALLRSQFLDIQVKAIPSHAERHIDSLRDVDIIVSVVGGDAPVLEKALCDKSQLGELPPVIACWLEAYAFAGHAVLIDESSTHSIGTIYPRLALLDEEYASTLEEKDAGCNANFMPYSFLEADQHITQFAKMIAQYAQAEKVLPVLTSIGDFNNLIANNLKSNISISPNSILRKSYEEIFTA